MSWFIPKCPVNEETKDWIEECFLWFVKEFGEETVLNSKVILPNEEFFTEPFLANENFLRTSLKIVCEFMQVDYESVIIETFTNEEYEKSPHPLTPTHFRGNKACGLYERIGDKHYILIETKLLNTPINLIATISHELGHAKLIGEKGFADDYQEEELLTDLITVFYGMGIFTANSLFTFNQWTNSSYQGWQMSREGYLTEEMVGYALAVFAFMRNESKPSWAKYLETNPKSYLKKSLKYLEKTDDTTIKKL